MLLLILLSSSAAAAECLALVGGTLSTPATRADAQVRGDLLKHVALLQRVDLVIKHGKRAK